MIALRAIAFHAMPCGCSACVLAIDDDGVDLIGIEHGPLERLHPAERSAGDRRQPRDPELVRKARSARTMSATVITGKSDPYGRPVAGFVDDGPRGAAAASEKVGADDKEAIGVEGFTRTDHAIPPAEPAAARLRRDPRRQTRRACPPAGDFENPAAWASPLNA